VKSPRARPKGWSWPKVSTPHSHRKG